MENKDINTIGIIALSGNCDKDIVLKSKNNLESLGYNVKLSNNIFKQDRYLAGSDKEKIKELHNFFLDKDIDLILCARGGYGGIRLINDIDYELIKNNPKPFCGFSDATSLLIMIYKRSGIITYHSPMACSDFYTRNHFTEDNFFNCIMGKNLIFEADKKVYREGKCEGVLFGGNLSTIVSLCGLDFIPEEDFVFFTEDINEPVYKIDKMFYQLLNIDKFKKYCKGIILGDFTGIDNEYWLIKLFEEISDRLKIPVVSGFKITHNSDKITLPIGKPCKLENRVLKIL